MVLNVLQVQASFLVEETVILTLTHLLQEKKRRVIVNKALQYKGINGPLVNLPFTDKDQIIYKEAVQRLYGLGIVTGMGDNLYVPKGTTTRGETASIHFKHASSY